MKKPQCQTFVTKHLEIKKEIEGERFMECLRKKEGW